MNANPKKLERIVKNFSGKKVLIIGDIMLDEYIFGITKRLSPEAPVPIVEVERIMHVPGGAANAANNVRSLGDETFLVGVIGKDETGQQLLNMLHKLGIKTDGILKLTDRQTILKSRIISQGQHIVRVDKEDRKEIPENIQKKLLRLIKKKIKNIDIVLISDYAKGVVTPIISQETIKLAKRANKKVLIDPKGEDFSKYRGCSIITPNLKELETALKISNSSLKSLPQSAKMLLAHVNSEAVLVTLGGKGMSLLDNLGNYIHIPSADVRVVDISGAGDTAVGTFSLSLAAGANFFEAMLVSIYACSVVIGKMGTATVSRNELLNVIKKVRLKKDEF